MHTKTCEPWSIPTIITAANNRNMGQVSAKTNRYTALGYTSWSGIRVRRAAGEQKYLLRIARLLGPTNEGFCILFLEYDSVRQWQNYIALHRLMQT